MSGFGGRRFLITGASSGIGRATAIAASKRGAKVALVGRSERRLEDVAELLEGEGHLTTPFDLSDLDNIPAMVQDISDRMGGLDCIVHSAGVRSTVPLRAISALSVRHTFDTNIASGIMLAKGFRRRQVPKTDGTLILIASVAALRGEAAMSTYAASKGAVISLTKSLAIELVRDGIRVNCVCPGMVLTEMASKIRSDIGEDRFRAIADRYPLGLGSPDDVAEPILFLASKASRWMTGSSLVVDGGYTAQ